MWLVAAEPLQRPHACCHAGPLHSGRRPLPGCSHLSIPPCAAQQPSPPHFPLQHPPRPLWPPSAGRAAGRADHQSGPRGGCRCTVGACAPARAGGPAAANGQQLPGITHLGLRTAGGWPPSAVCLSAKRMLPVAVSSARLFACLTVGLPLNAVCTSTFVPSAARLSARGGATRRL